MERGSQGGWEGARCALGVGFGEASGQAVYQEGDTWCLGRRAGSHSVVAKVPASTGTLRRGLVFVGSRPRSACCEPRTLERLQLLGPLRQGPAVAVAPAQPP